MSFQEYVSVSVVSSQDSDFPESYCSSTSSDSDDTEASLPDFIEHDSQVTDEEWFPDSQSSSSSESSQSSQDSQSN